MTKYQVVKAAELDAEKLTFEDLRCHFGTGRSYVISGTGRDRKTGYRTGVQTDVGCATTAYSESTSASPSRT